MSQTKSEQSGQDRTVEQDDTTVIVEEVRCPTCDYDVRGIDEKPCPECGEMIRQSELRETQIPWSFRRQIGHWRAFWRTFFLVSFRTKRFSREVVRPVSLKDAKRFRRVVVTLLWLSACVFVAAYLLALGADLEDVYEGLIEQLGFPLVIAGGGLIAGSIWLFLLALTGVHTYWLHPRRMSVSRQNRAVALGYYACAPLVIWLIAPVTMIALLSFVELMGWEDGWDVPDAVNIILTVVAVIGVFGVTIAAVVGFLTTCLRLAASSANRGPAGTIGMLIGLPIVWVLLAVLILGVLPASIAYLALMIDSLQRM